MTTIKRHCQDNIEVYHRTSTYCAYRVHCDIGPMLAQCWLQAPTLSQPCATICLQRWPNLYPVLVKCTVFAGYLPSKQTTLNIWWHNVGTALVPAASIEPALDQCHNAPCKHNTYWSYDKPLCYLGNAF